MTCGPTYAELERFVGEAAQLLVEIQSIAVIGERN
jgi:hypothetical protein